jgi:hypothetical protein
MRVAIPPPPHKMSGFRARCEGASHFARLAAAWAGANVPATSRGVPSGHTAASPHVLAVQDAKYA